MATVDSVNAAYKVFFGANPSTAAATSVAAAIDAGTTTLDSYIAGLVKATASTSLSLMATYAYITGKTPKSTAVTSLLTFAQTQNAAYAKAGGNANLAAAEAVGKALAADATTKDAFKTKFSNGTDADFIDANYYLILGTVPSAGAKANLTAQVAAFTKLFTTAGIAATDAALQARGAVLGQMVGYALTDPTFSSSSTLDDQTITMMTNAALGDATVYGTFLPPVILPGAAQPIRIRTAADDVGPTAPILRTTSGPDTILGTLAEQVKIDGGLGIDTMIVDILAANGPTTPTITQATQINNVEIVKVGAAGKASSQVAWIDLTLDTGITEFWHVQASTGIDVPLIASGISGKTKIGVDQTPTNSDFRFLTQQTTGDLMLNQTSGGAVSIGTGKNDGVVNLSAHVTNGALLNALVLDKSSQVLTIDGSGNLTIGAVTAPSLNTFDASGLAGTLTTTLPLGADLTVTATANADTISAAFFADTNTTVATVLTIRTGDGADTILLASGSGKDKSKSIAGNLTFNPDSSAKVIGSITDFTPGQDKLDLRPIFNATDYFALSPTDLTSIKKATTLQNAFVLAANKIGASKLTVFEYGSDTYVFHNDSFAGLNLNLAPRGTSPGDGAIKLTGVTNLTIALTAGTTGADILFA